MFSILIGLAVAVAVALGWFSGNRFVCVFLSLPVIAVGLFGAAVGTPLGVLMFPLTAVGVLALIWAPLYLRRRNALIVHEGVTWRRVQ